MKDNFARNGRVEWIGLRPEKRGDMVAVDQVDVKIGTGLEGDHYNGGFKNKRDVTLIQFEHLEVISQLVGRDTVSPNLLRRNIAVSGINLASLKDKQFQIGEVVLEGTGLCHPCSRMERNLGEGGYNAVRGHGGITARVVTGGTVNLGDSVRLHTADKVIETD